MGWLRLFRLTKREYYADFFITPPTTLAMLVFSIRDGVSVRWCCGLAIGLLGWSLYEYALHRWVLHKVPGFRDMHDLHHARQKDYIAVHPALTLSIYAALWAVFGFGSSAVMIGFSLGYIAYSVTHTAFHYTHIPKGHWLYGMKMRHAAHHRTDVCFGVTTSLWDKIFNTEGN
jgi:sterol desaturase/sphingolipid hydroxylase (fatty acid hydroxylase superfamily)